MLIVFIPFARELYRLDVSTHPATVLAMEKLDDWALFLGEEPKGMTLSCMSPEKWGRRSNTAYHADGLSQTCSFHGLWEETDHWNSPPSRDIVDCYSGPAWAVRWDGERDPVELALPVWLYPSMFYSGAGE
ncbi:hypothetical protein D1007_46308 [Hordeum vulgare]|nr:hypothetical protein D1007_46308 [Hordeum vulgare]